MIMNKNWLNYILEQLHREAFIWARQCCDYDDEMAKEVLQVVYLKMLEGRARYREKSKVKTWLFSVIRFTAIDLQKERHHFIGLEGLANTVEEKNNDCDLDYEPLLRELSQKQHQVLVLAFYHNMTLAEIAEVTGMTIGTVRTHYDRGKKALKELILKEKANGGR